MTVTAPTTRRTWLERGAGLAGVVAVVAMATPAAAEHGPRDLDAWVAAGLARLSDSPTIRALEEARRSGISAMLAAIEESPWTVRSSLSHTQPFPRRGQARRSGNSVPFDTVRSYDVQASAELAYQRRSRFTASLAGTTGYLENLESQGAEAADVPFSVDLTIAYDLLRGGADSAEHERARAVAMRALASSLATEAARLQAELRFVDEVVAIFANRCQLDEMERVREAVGRALEGARTQLDAKVMSKPDYMNYVHLENVVLSQRSGLERQRAAVLDGMLAWGSEIRQVVEALLNGPVDCPKSSDITGVDRSIAALDPLMAHLPVLAAQLPAHIAARAEQLASSHDLAATRTERLPGLAPYVAGRVERVSPLDEEVGSAQLGIQLDWTVAQGREARLEEAASQAHAAATRRVQESLQQGMSTLRALQGQIAAERRLLDVLSRTVDNSDALGRALEVQRAIGEVDALNQTSAYVSTINAKLSYLDSWARLQTSLYRVRAIDEAAKRTAEDRERLDDVSWTR